LYKEDEVESEEEIKKKKKAGTRLLLHRHLPQFGKLPDHKTTLWLDWYPLAMYTIFKVVLSTESIKYFNPRDGDRDQPASSPADHGFVHRQETACTKTVQDG
jgi:hypothetical protein